MKDFSKQLITQNAPIKDALEKINKVPQNLTLFVLNEEDQLVGTLTDGDIRRGFLRELSLTDTVEQFMSRKFHSLKLDNLSTYQIKEIKKSKIQLVPVIDKESRICKVIDFHQIKSILPIEAVLMAGGSGIRLRPLTDHMPKPLIPVGNKPIIEHNIDRLISYGVDNFHITIKYLGQQIIDFLGDGSDKDINISYIDETIPLGTIGSVSRIKKFKFNDVLIMNSDLFTNIDFEEFYQAFIDEKADMAVASVPYNVNVPYAVLEKESNKITSFKEKPTFTYYSNAGIYLIKKEYLKLIPEDTYFEHGQQDP